MSVVRAGPHRHGLRMTVKLALQLFVLAALITTAAALLALLELRATLDRQMRDELDAMQRSTEEQLQRRREDVAESLRRLESYLTSNTALLGRFFLGGPDLQLEARPLMHLYGLDLLEILDGAGKVLSSGHRPERINLMADRFVALPEDEQVLTSLPLAEASVTGMVERHLLRYSAGRTLMLVGGRRLDVPFLDAIARGEVAVLVPTASDRNPVSSAAATEPFVRVARRWVGQAPEPLRPSKQIDEDGRRWWVAGLPLPEWEQSAPAWLVWGVSAEPFADLLRQMTGSFVILGSVVGLLAAFAGVWFARGITRPLDNLGAAFDRIAAGEADYTFDVRGGDEIQELLTAFSRMHRALEQQRRRSLAAERVAAWREVARHVAHEVKNPLVPIRVTVENLLRAKRTAPERFERMFDEGMHTILQEVQQLSRIVGEFTEFARLPLPALRPVELEALIDQALELYAVDPGTTVRRFVPRDLPAVHLDPDQISRALKNVIGNAIEAARERDGGGGLVEVRVGVVDDAAEVEVLDNGSGFSEEASRRIFEPYFTTKEHGTGLGMALTYRIIIEHGGTIFAENRPQGGARVVIRLPLATAEPQAAAAQGVQA